MKSRTIALAAAAAALGLGADQAAASYKASVQAGTLKVTGDNAADKLVLSLRPAAPTILELDVGADGTADFAFDRLGFAAIDVAASGGDDEVRVDQRFGAFFDEALTVDGGAGADMLLGGSGMDTLRGGSGNDVVTGGDGNDRALLGSGNDRTVWNPGDDNDTIEGESGSDSLEFNGSGAPERVEVSANGPRVRFTRDVANVVTDLDGVERVAFRAAGSSDMVGVHPLAGTDLETVDIDLQTDGQPDNVVVIGSADDDRIAAGGDGAAVVVDGIGAETRISGAEAQDAITLRGQAGADVIASGPGVPGPATVRAEGDGGADTAIYDGTNGPETFEVVAITGEAVAHSAAAAPFAVMTTVESFALRGNGGADTIAGLGNLAGVTPLTMDGGSGDDVLRGGNGGDLLVGGSGDDVADGNQGQDTARLGSGNDQYWWDPGDSSDVVDGEGGSDAFESNGSNAGETVAFSAVGPAARFTRNIGSVVVDLDDVERMGYRAHGGEDAVTVDDLGGTDVDVAFLDIQGIAAGGDGARDTVTVNGSDRADAVRVSRFEDQVRVTGLAAQTWILGSEPANDTLRVNARGGNDTITLDSGLDQIATLFDLGADE